MIPSEELSTHHPIPLIPFARMLAFLQFLRHRGVEREPFNHHRHFCAYRIYLHGYLGRTLV